MAPMRAAVAGLLVSAAAAGGASRGLCRDQLLVQTAIGSESKMRARAAQRPPARSALLQMDGRIAQSLRWWSSDPRRVAASVSKGVEGASSAVEQFAEDKVEDGLNSLGSSLLEAVSEPVKQTHNDSLAHKEFEEEWMRFFGGAAASLPGVRGNITLFQESGSPEAAIAAMSKVLAALGDGVVELVPPETAQEVVKYVDAISDVLGALGTSWVGFDGGQETTQAVEDLYFGLRSAMDRVLPEKLRTDDVYRLAIGALDGVMHNLSEIVLAFRRDILERAVCWKVQRSRRRTRPSACPEGFHWDGVHLCLPLPHGAPEASGALDAGVARKAAPVDSTAGGKQPIPDGARAALCKEGGEHAEKMGAWCYAACPEGTVPAGLRCKTLCQGEFPADDGAAMCGQSRTVLTAAVMNIVFGVTQGAINSGVLIASMVKDGVDAEPLARTIGAFVDMGKRFAFQQCPLPGDSRQNTSAPTETPTTRQTE